MESYTVITVSGRGDTLEDARFQLDSKNFCVVVMSCLPYVCCMNKMYSIAQNFGEFGEFSVIRQSFIPPKCL